MNFTKKITLAILVIISCILISVAFLSGKHYLILYPIGIFIIYATFTYLPSRKEIKAEKENPKRKTTFINKEKTLEELTEKDIYSAVERLTTKQRLRAKQLLIFVGIIICYGYFKSVYDLSKDEETSVITNSIIDDAKLPIELRGNYQEKLKKLDSLIKLKELKDSNDRELNNYLQKLDTIEQYLIDSLDSECSDIVKPNLKEVLEVIK